ncbi:MAG: hypothetical protein PHQ05_10660 [Sterolibacterium sp.]|nr:hypothetical protein [Sterolibacterium sp.]
MSHLFVDISAHGLGHLAQTAPVLNQLHRTQLRLTVRSGLSLHQLRRRISAPFEFIPGEPDFGFVMRNALDIDLAKSASRYQQRHRNWSNAIAAEADFLRQLKPDLVLSNVAYLPLAGAARIGVPAVAMCSLNWADLFAHYFSGKVWAASIHDEMLCAYHSAAAFLRVTPGMPMSALANLQPIGPIASNVPAQRTEVATSLGIPVTERWVLVALGGIEHRLPVEAWPKPAGVRWLVPDNWEVSRADVSSYGQQVSFINLLASADALITKTGYGSFAEASCNGIPVLYLRRPDWPEEPCLIEWLKAHSRSAEITRAEAHSGMFVHRLEEVWNTACPARPHPHGITEACACISRLLQSPHL